MPVIALPPNVVGCCPTGCTSITPISPVIYVSDSGECKAEPLGVRCYQSQSVDLAWVFRDSRGEPVDLTGCTIATVQFRMQEIICKSILTVDVACTTNDLVPGGLKVTLPADSTVKPGVYEAEFGLSVNQGSGSLLRHINRGYIIIEGSMFGAQTPRGSLGPPSVDEVLLTVQMADPSRSDLLRRYEWSLAEIALAIAKPVEYWNTALPPIGIDFDTSDFPLRWEWREAVIGELMRSAAAGYMRDDMMYQGGSPGSAFADKAKWEQYYKVGDAKWEKYTSVVLAQKAAYNMRNGYAFLGTPYSLLSSW